MAILIPIVVLVIQGAKSLELRRQQLETSLFAELERPKNQLFQDLFFQWSDFLEGERIRPFAHYRPIIVPEKASVYAPDGAVQRSPLYDKIDRLDGLTVGDQLDLETGASESSDDQSTKPKEIFDRALVGYFEFDPVLNTVVTPYDPTRTFDSDLGMPDQLAAFRIFLGTSVIPDVRERFNITSADALHPSSFLLRFKTRRITKVREPISNLHALDRMPGNRATRGPQEGQEDWIDVSYYDFSFASLSTPGGRYVYGLRTVLLGDQVKIQGMIFNLISLLQETQAYLEPLQPKYGSVVVSFHGADSERAFFEPFSDLAVRFDIYDDKYLESYRAEMKRFWLTITFLSLTLLASLAHIYFLLRAEKHLLEQKDDFVSAVTHELKAPLTSIRMYAEMLEEGWAAGKEKTYYRTIHAEAKRLGRLVQNILDFAKIERRKFSLRPVDIALTSFFSEIVESWRCWIEERGFTIELDFRADPVIHADPEAMIQVAYNVCDNAVKYAQHAASPTLTIGIREDEETAIIVFADNGPGIPKEDHRKIFDRFYRGENELTREHTGTGLGLSLVKEIVEKNGGIVEVVAPSAEATGFVLEMRFPRVSSSAQDEATDG